jgi:hypothetical protein
MSEGSQGTDGQGDERHALYWSGVVAGFDIATVDPRVIRRPKPGAELRQVLRGCDPMFSRTDTAGRKHAGILEDVRVEGGKLLALGAAEPGFFDAHPDGVHVGIGLVLVSERWTDSGGRLEWAATMRDLTGCSDLQRATFLDMVVRPSACQRDADMKRCCPR